MTPAFAVIVASLTGVGFVAILGAGLGSIRDAFLPDRERGLNPPPCERAMRPEPTPRPPGPFGQQTFPIYPRPGDADYRTKVEPATPWPPSPPPPPRRERGPHMWRPFPAESSIGMASCSCANPRWGPHTPSDVAVIKWCFLCGRPKAPWRSMPGAAFEMGIAPVGWIMPSRGQDGGPRPVWGAR